MTIPTSPWDTVIAELAVLPDTELRSRLKLELQKAFRSGYKIGRSDGYDEAAMLLTPTRHDMGG
jgi:hypothetical protein